MLECHEGSSMTGMNLYEVIGGRVKCHELARAFFARVPDDPVLRAVYPASLNCAIEGVGTFLVQLLGGPCEYAQERRATLSLKEAHARFRIGEKEREAWLRNMRLAMGDVRIHEPAQRALTRLFEEAAGFLVNSGPVREASRRPPENSLQEDAGARWAAHLRLELLIELTRDGQAAAALEMAESPEMQCYFQRDRAALLSWMAIACGVGELGFMRHARTQLSQEPELVLRRLMRGRTVLHEAAAEGGVELVELVLYLGGDPNAEDAFGHAPLYFAASAPAMGRTELCGPSVVRALAKAGAQVDHQGGAKRCAAIHQAARRGNTTIVGALLDSGADIEVRDAYGETPLRRAVNCLKVETAQLLLDRGANAFSVGSKGLTPMEAATRLRRDSAMKRLFISASVCRQGLGA
jgi:truncated hemoglobin YjbI